MRNGSTGSGGGAAATSAMGENFENGEIKGVSVFSGRISGGAATVPDETRTMNGVNIINLNNAPDSLDNINQVL